MTNVQGDVIVLVHANWCGSCKQLLTIWSDATSKNKDNVVNALKKMNPSLTFLSVEIDDSVAKSHFPPSLFRYMTSFPSVIFIPKDEWNRAVADRNYQLTHERIRIFNTAWNSHRSAFVPLQSGFYPRSPQGFVRWLSEISAHQTGFGSAAASGSADLLITAVTDPEEKKKKTKKHAVCTHKIITLRR